MTLKELTKIGKLNTTISTGYATYVGYTEKWKRGRYNNNDTEFYVSSLGRVYDFSKNKYVKLFMNDSGYLYCQSYYKGIRTSLLINKLVAETFLGYPKNIHKPEADHINSNKLDNNINNLQWLSNIDNLAKRTLSDQSGENNNNRKYTSELIISIADDLQSGMYTVQEISDKYNIPRKSILNIKSKHRWKNLLENYDFSKVPKAIKSKNEYSDQDIINVANLLIENKLSLKEIANKTNVSYDTVLNIKNKKGYHKILSSYDFSGYNKVKTVFSTETKAKIISLLIKGYSPFEICKILNLDYSKKTRNAIYELKRKCK
jgi:predicted DNA-binding protein YlxM (UPF0122 family)